MKHLSRLLALFAALLLLKVAAAPLADVSATPGSPSTHAIPYKQERHGDDDLATRSLASLALVGLLAFGMVWGIKRFGLSGRLGKGWAGQRRLRQVEAIRLGRHSSLHVVHYHDEELLLVEAGQAVQLLVRRPLAATPPEANPKPGGGHDVEA
ncbi:flagellar biosynthetic protein FliO [Chitinimonas sp.]|uniref:flagellar biosynthetic protein FliO n=1 Tax=Chitinimonas sp. TaxID=1934313 RepID=UPI0035B0075D